jgi:hypothetical protein
MSPSRALHHTDALANIQSHWLVAVAVPIPAPGRPGVTPARRRWLTPAGLTAVAATAVHAATAPVACQSYGEIADAVTGAAVKAFAEVPADGGAGGTLLHPLAAAVLWLRLHVHGVVVVLVAYAVWAHLRMAATAQAQVQAQVHVQAQGAGLVDGKPKRD